MQSIIYSFIKRRQGKKKKKRPLGESYHYNYYEETYPQHQE